MVVFAARIRPLFTLVPHEAVIGIVTRTIIRATALAELAGFAIRPVFRRLRHWVDFGTSLAGSGIHVSSSSREGREQLNPIQGCWNLPTVLSDRE